MAGLVWFVLTGAAGALVALLAWTALNPWDRWRMRNVPGEWPVPFLGILLSFAKLDQTLELDRLYRKYSNAFKVWFAHIPFVIVKDAAVGRKLALSCNTRPDLTFFSVRYGRLETIWNTQCIFENDESKWRPVRKMFEAAVLQPAAVAAQAPFISKAIERATDRIAAYARAGQPVEFLATAADLTMDVVAWAVFGLDLNATGNAAAASSSRAQDVALASDPQWWNKFKPGSPEFGARLAASARVVMYSMDAAKSSIYNQLAFVFWLLKPAIKVLSKYLPDKKKNDEMKALLGLAEGIQVLVNDYSARQLHGSSNGHGAHGGHAKQILSDTSFLSRWLSGKELEFKGDKNDLNIIAQVQQLLLAGYDATSITVVMAMYFLANNPEKQTALQQELDNTLHGKFPDHQDLASLPYCCAVVDETLRVHNVGPLVRENPHGSTDLGHGVRVPKNTPLMIPLYSFNRDSSIWPRADEFLPERFMPGNAHLSASIPNALMPFGVGARMCPGYKLGLLEVRMAVARLMQRFNVTLAPGAAPPNLFTSLSFQPDRVDLLFSERH